jgi:hypothetical protein
MKTFHVLEPHVDGTKLYSPDGENNTREADENEVKHLVDLGILSTEKPKGKAEGGAPANKAEGKAPANKTA